MAKKVKVAGIPEGFTEHLYTMGDLTLNYVVGPENGFPLLLIPGQMESWQGYKPVMPELSRRFHIYVPDLRGHGKSTWTPGHYSYNICGEDLKRFIQEVIRRPALAAGLSSGAVLTIWLAANAPADVLAIISEDPPIFSSIWPRIVSEKFMARNFQIALDFLSKPGERDLEGWLAHTGIPAEGKDELLMIPPLFVKAIASLYRANRTLRPDSPYDVPFLPYNMRAGMKFLSEYDTDFSRATLDGDLSKDFDPQETLKRVKCPMLLMRANASRHPTWGLLGAIDDDDLERMHALVPHMQYVQIKGPHELHMAKPEIYIAELTRFVDGLQARELIS